MASKLELRLAMAKDHRGKPSDPPVNVYINGYNFCVPLSTMEESRYELCWCDFLPLLSNGWSPGV